jgi:hypothetical protein
MSKLYLLLYNRGFGTREEVKACLDSLPEITAWRTEIPNSFYLVSEKRAVDLVPLLRQCRGENGKFLITEITANRQGWLSPDSWVFMRQEKPPTK